MNIEEFKRSVIPKHVRVDDTDDYRAGMKIIFNGDEKPHMIMDVLNQNDITVIELDTLH